MATKFVDIAKAPKNLLVDDYSTKVNLKCKKAAGPVAVTIETDRGSGGALSSKIGTKFAYSGLSVDKAQMTADGGHVLETSIRPCKGVTVHFKGNRGADLGVDYTTGALYATGVVDVKDLSRVSTSVAYGLKGFVFGGQGTYALSGKSGVTAFNLGASYSTGPVVASITTASKLSQVNLGFVYNATPTLKIGSSTTHSSDKVCDLLAIGGAYSAPFGVIKAKVNGSGIVSASLVKDVASKVTLTASGSVSPTDLSSFKYGLGIAM